MGRFSKAVPMEGRTIGGRQVQERAPSRGTSRSAYWWTVCRCGRRIAVRGRAMRRGVGKLCRYCAMRRLRLTVPSVRALVVLLERPNVRSYDIRVELRCSIPTARAMLVRLTRKKWAARSGRGTYSLLPAGLAILTGIAKGEIKDRFGVQGRVLTVLDGTRRSGRTTVAHGR